MSLYLLSHWQSGFRRGSDPLDLQKGISGLTYILEGDGSVSGYALPVLAGHI